jgi:tetratricopeptide (TPR) repeat protein
MVIVVWIALMTACNPKSEFDWAYERPCGELEEIDSIMWHQPDSAFALLQAFTANPKADSLDELNSHYCQLLISELLYKNYYRQSNRKDLLKAVDYFDSTNNVFLSARGHYINGVGYYELDSVTEACAEYLMALEIMENHFKATELTGTKAIFMFLTFNRLLSLFSSQFMMDPAITCGEQALAYCQKEPSLHKEIPNTYFHIGKQYDLKGIKDVASDYYGRAIEFLDTSTLIYRDAVSMKALCDYQMGLSTEQSLNTIKQTLSNAEGEKEKMSRFVAIGAIFLNEGIYDSAQYYFETVYMEETSPMIKKGIAESLRSVYDSIGNRERSDECMRYLAEHKKPEGENKAMISQLGDKYMTYIGQKPKRQAEEDRKRSLKKYVEFFISLLFSIVLAIIILTKRKERKLLKHQEEAMENEQYAHRMAQAAMSGKLKHKNKEVLDLKNQIRQYDNDPTKKTVTATSFVEEPVCRLIMKRVTEGRFKSKVDYLNYKDSALTKQELLELRLDADHHFNQFTSRLKKAYPELTNSDLDYCCLYLLGLSDADIAALMQRAYNTVIERNGKIRRILGCESSLPITLMGIAKKPLSI